MPYANIKIPAGLLDESQKRELVSGIADALANVFGEGSRATTMILIEDVPDGGFYRANEVITADIVRARRATQNDTGPTAL